MRIDNGFKNNYGDYYDNIVYIDFDSNEEMINNLGRFIIETKEDDFKFNGILLHKMINHEDNDYAFRIYRDYENVISNRRYDDKFISELQRKQSNVRLTSFPIGIVSVKGYVVGQIVLYYNNMYTLHEYLLNCNDINSYKECYIKVIDIMDELIKNKIFYRDIHSKNFMVDSNVNINLIDFDSSRIDFELNKGYMSIEDKLIYMFNHYNKNMGFKFDKCSSMNEIKERVLKL